MANDYGWVWLDRDVSAEVMQFAVEQSPLYGLGRGEDPSIENFYGDTRIAFDGGTMIRKWTIRDAVFRTKSDCESFFEKVQNTTGTMRFELQVATGLTSTNMFKFDGSNTTYEVAYVNHDRWEKMAPGDNTKYKIGKITLQEG